MRVMVFVKATEDRHKMCSKCAGMFWKCTLPPHPVFGVPGHA
jgi:hypothetical protein